MNKEMIAMILSGGRDNLANTAAAVPDDKLNWKPMDQGRTVLDLLGEAGQTAEMVARLIASKGEDKPTREMFGQMRQERAEWTRDDAMQHLSQGHEHLLKAIESCSEDELSTPVTLAMGGGMTMPLGAWAMMAYRTDISRFAQINYIQTLYGDMEAH